MAGSADEAFEIFDNFMDVVPTTDNPDRQLSTRPVPLHQLSIEQINSLDAYRYCFTYSMLGKWFY